MLRTEQPQFMDLVRNTLAEYVKPATPTELESWWMTCKVFTLRDVQRALAAHVVDPDDGKRAPRPIDVKRRLMTGAMEAERGPVDPHQAERHARHYLQSIRSPAVVGIAWDIALRHGNRPWQGAYAEADSAKDVVKR
jgi:hypothetical protein